jgi:DNA-binding protein YbaB
VAGNDDHGLERLGRSVAETGERVGRIGPVTGTASSGDNAITVSVSPGGMLRSVDIRPAVLGRQADEVAAEVMRLAARATKTANARMHSSLKSVISPSASKSLENLGMPAGEHAPEPDDDFGGVLQ